VFSPPRFHPNRPSLVRPVRVDPTGECGPTRKQARGPRWRRTSQGFYVPSQVPADDSYQRIVEASVLMRPGEAVTGRAALCWLGARWFDARQVDLVTCREVVPPPGVQVSQEFLRPGEVVTVDGLPITVPVRSVCFEVRHAATLTEAVTALDMAAYSDLVSIRELAAYAAALGPWTGIPQCRKAVGLASENAWSPPEVMMRLLWTLDAYRTPVLCNAPVFDRFGRHVGTPDLLDPVAGVIGEYDGPLHLAGRQRAQDLRREGDFRGLGLEYVTMVAGDAADHYQSFRHRLETAYRNARRMSEHERVWTVEPPRWWTDTATVAARRALDPRARDRLLRYRRTA